MTDFTAAQNWTRYLVGGAVRDQLLGLGVKDRDWVITGATPEQLTRQGYRQVGADFPVFLHPETGEEHALARTERKSGSGYQGFICDFSPDITLEEDLRRRDLTINAMAMTEDGDLVDPYGGRADLEARVLRHVSPAFAEDPLRVVRVARFAARFSSLGFAIAPETRQLMKQMVDQGELSDLTAERVWQDMALALTTQHPSEFFYTLRELGALVVLLPELDRLFGVPQTMRYHPEVDTGIHAMQALDKAAELTSRLDVRFAVLCHDFGKGVTPRDLLPGHQGHEERGIPLIEAVCERLKVSKALRRLAVLTCQWHTHCHRLPDLRPATVLKMLEPFKPWQDRQMLEGFALACRADARGRSGFEETAYAQADWILELAEAASQVETGPLIEAGYQGPALGEAIRQARIKAIGRALKAIRSTQQQHQ
ncbi:MAG: multifunctional CCA addition/repair protein [Natronospirillum sp.]|uniref:multifunctional CCA addition/repair protein n=1 Tax=Natronospirillum sp. TaxID=2812955 RepID=UPI0025F52369|nr:multifunctional CCA addition/repair protein [Natronospirillum sp.]MCH8553380.1 multifunctional CCA addition/repair protein [Natronospirillum sp.]